ncbi:hypothetical protein [Xaviernesmea oryzae]|uniref:hypothetical protein n=1 Tax=Xaviernesmea oryzae TaxID=464029 RepID=UPI0008AB351B|nr:hypothetical protein [Xaviernesmea oryzae]SEM11245.1 hypothetical protein SAMN04487976_11990 [Xaviernesmea oryzae]
MNESIRNYVASMLIEIARMVPSSRQPFLAYLIEMAAIEAKNQKPSDVRKTPS